MANNIPVGTAGQMMYKGSVDWEAMNVDSSALSSLEIDGTNGLQVAASSIDDDKIGVITGAGKISGAALISLANTLTGAGAIPAANLTGAPLTGGFFASNRVHTGTAPTSWTDIDMGIPLEYRVSLVVFAVYESDFTPSGEIWFRTKGETVDVTDPVSDTKLGGGMSSFYFRDGEGAYLAVQTDSLGVVQWKVANASMKIAVDLRVIIPLDN